MEWPLQRSFEAQPDIAAAETPQIRLFTVPKKKALAPVDKVSSKWELCSPATVPNFSAVAYYFGRSLQRARQVPVGLIHTSWGGSPAEVWMSETALNTNEGYRRDIMAAYATTRQNYDRALTQWQSAIESERGRSSACVWWRRPP